MEITRRGGRSEERETDSSSVSNSVKGSHQSEASTVTSSLAFAGVAIGVNPDRVETLAKSNSSNPRFSWFEFES